jgi:hypothetical protein
MIRDLKPQWRIGRRLGIFKVSSKFQVPGSKFMATIKTFEDIEAWRKARELSRDIFEQTLKETFAKDYSLKDQVNRASGSIMDNIAEGSERVR